MSEPTDKLLQLRRAYAAKLPGKIEALRAAWRQSPPDLAALAALAHQLAGTAPSFGYQELGLLAATLEERLEAGVPADPGPVEAILERLAALAA
jgi:HPt (histidine-containing phosphotransfer) domain-containing protein